MSRLRPPSVNPAARATSSAISAHLLARLQVALGIDPPDMTRVESDQQPRGVEHVCHRGITAIGITHRVAQHHRQPGVGPEARPPRRSRQLPPTTVMHHLELQLARLGQGSAPPGDMGSGERSAPQSQRAGRLGLGPISTISAPPASRASSACSAISSRVLIGVPRSPPDASPSPTGTAPPSPAGPKPAP